MIKINFVCHGNICRSPMAEFLFKDLIKEKGTESEFLVASSATSTEELGNPVHYGTAKILDRLGIDYSKKRAVQVQKGDYSKYDLFIGMDEANVKNLKRLFGGDPENKVKMLLEYAGVSRGVADPWWTGDFSTTYFDVNNGITALYKTLKGE